MIVLIDGKEMPVVNDVKVIYDVPHDDDTGEEVAGQLHVTCNAEGLVFDAIVEGLVEKTACLEAYEYGWELLNDGEGPSPRAQKLIDAAAAVARHCHEDVYFDPQPGWPCDDPLAESLKNLQDAHSNLEQALADLRRPIEETA